MTSVSDQGTPSSGLCRRIYTTSTLHFGSSPFADAPQYCRSQSRSSVCLEWNSQHVQPDPGQLLLQ